MTALFSILSIILAMMSAMYLQLPTFILALGYRWFHRYQQKRWIFRTAAAMVYVAFICTDPPPGLVILISLPFLFFLIFSLLNANPKVYIALNEEQIIKDHYREYADDTAVLGYVDESEAAIAYPLEEMVRPRHLLNDTFNGTPLLISYCMACRSAMVYDPLIDGRRLHFEVLGVYRRNMVMGDVETGTIWQQATGKAMYGHLKGRQLQYLPYQQMALSDWLTQYKNSQIAYEASSVRDGIFSKERLMKMMKITEHLVAPGKTNLQGLPLREQVFGVEIAHHSKAYPVGELKKVGWSFKDYIGDHEVIIEYNKKNNRIHVTEVSSGRPLIAQSHRWFGWKEFHPDTEVWTA